MSDEGGTKLFEQGLENNLDGDEDEQGDEDFSAGPQIQQEEVTKQDSISELEQTAYKDASREREMSDIEYAMEEIDDQNDIYAKGLRNKKLKKQISSIEERISDALSEITGVKKFVFDAASYLGANMYRRRVEKHKEQLEDKAIRLQEYIDRYESKLEKDDDDNEDKDVSKKGIAAQRRHYQKMCRGIADTLRRTRNIMKGLEKDKAETKDKIDDYMDKAHQNPEDPEVEDKLEFYRERKENIIEDIINAQKRKKRLQHQIKVYHNLNGSAKVAEATFKRSIRAGKEVLNDLHSKLTLMEIYLENCDDYKSLVDFQEEMKVAMTMTEQTDNVNGEVHKILSEQYVVLDDELKKIQSQSSVEKQYQDVVESENKAAAREDKVARKLEELYT